MGSLGWPEILVILVLALIIFGPRKLPELGKTLGQSLAQFRKASDDFKRTWQDEVETEKRRLEESISYPPETSYDSSYNPYEVIDHSADTGTETTTSGTIDGQPGLASDGEKPTPTSPSMGGPSQVEEAVPREKTRDWM